MFERKYKRANYGVPVRWGGKYHKVGQERPDLTGSWLLKGRGLKTTIAYYMKLHWATPPWLTREQMGEIKAHYAGTHPDFDHVDHIVPLKHELVCGLHVPWNLQRITRMDNLRKSNNWWPDCPDHLCPEKNGTLALELQEQGPHQLSLPVTC